MSLVAVPALSIQSLRSDYSGKNTIIDALLTRYDQLEADAQRLRVSIFGGDDLFYETMAGIKLAHPLIGPLQTYERLMYYTLRELGFAVRMYEQTKPEAEDTVDTFLASMEARQRPHHAMNRPIDASSTG
jgi:hypothetical protein